MQPETVIFVANSPGEIAGWLVPLVDEVKKRWPNCRIVLQLLLCEFASGQEQRIGHDILGLEEIRTPSQYWSNLFRDLKRYPSPIIVHLGGDMMYSALLAWRWKVPLWIYVWGRKWMDSVFSGYLVRNEYDRNNLLKKGIADTKIHRVGDLVVDATAVTLARQQEHLKQITSSPSSGTPQEPSSGTPQEPSSGTPQEPSSGTPREPSSGTPKEPSCCTSQEPSNCTSQEPSNCTSQEPSRCTSQEPSRYTSQEPSNCTSQETHGSAPLISILPGSRTRELSHLGPFFLEVAREISQRIPGSRFQLIVSPFINRQELQSMLTTPPLPEMGGVQGVFDGEHLRDEENRVAVRIIQEDHLAHLAESSLAVTIPGTKTSELSCLGVPMVCVLPINRPDMLPITGIIGWLDFLPWLGPWLKKTLVLAFVKPSRFYALPNLLAQDRIVPEVVGVLTVPQIANALVELWKDEAARQSQRQALRELYEPSRGAAQRFIECIAKQ